MICTLPPPLVMLVLVLLLLEVRGRSLPVHWTETSDILWCSGGGDWHAYRPANPFGRGNLTGCPILPHNWSMAQGVAACEKLCMQSEACLGFTWYPSQSQQGGGNEGTNETSCCFRTGSVDSKPPCGGKPTCAGTRCFQKWAPPSDNITIAVGRRPYVFETTGHVLVRPMTSVVTKGVRCNVSADLVGVGIVLSNGSWTLDLGSAAVTSFPFSLAPLPSSLEDSLHVTIDCPSLGWTTDRYRAFQRAPGADAPSRSVSQVEYMTYALTA